MIEPLAPPKYEKAGLIVGFFVIISLILFGALGGVAGLVSWVIGLFEISFTGAIWAGVALILGVPIFRRVFVEHRHDVTLRKLHLISMESEYFLVKPSYPKTITGRFLQTLSVFLLFSSTIAYWIPSSLPRTPLGETFPFVQAGIYALLFVMPLVALLWLYEDSGLRKFRKNDNTVVRVGSLFEQLLFGSGGASAFYKLVTSLNGPVTAVIGWAIAVIIVFPAICFVLTVLFHEALEFDLIKQILEVAKSHNFPQREIQLV